MKTLSTWNLRKTWNKKLAGMALALFMTIILCAIPTLPILAADNPPRLVDMADLLSDSEEADLSGLLDEISTRQQVDVVVVTVGSMEGKTAMEYADDYYDENGYGFGDGRDGILLLVSMEDRDWYISTSGYGITAVTDAGREYMAENFLDDLSAGEYAAAFTSFADQCDDYLTQAKTGEAYDVDNVPLDPVSYFMGSFAAAFVAAFIIALIATGIMRLKLKSVFSRSAADDYVRQGSMQLTRQSDLFLYRQVNRRKKEEHVSSSPASSGGQGGSRIHQSSSGATHGGGGGKF